MNAISNVLRTAGAVAYGSVTYKLCDGGLSKTLVLEELTHGTDLISNIKIRFLGGEPSKPGYKPNYPCYTNTTNYFYLYKDSEYNRIRGEVSDFEKNQTSLLQLLKYNLGKKMNRWVYLLDNTSNASGLQFHRYFRNSELEKPKPVDYAVMVLGTILSPTLRFHFSEIDPKRLEEDTNHPGFAYKTREVVEPWRIGPVGSCLTGLNAEWLSRVKDNPLKALAGVAELAGGAALLVLGRSQARIKLPWAIAGALLA